MKPNQFFATTFAAALLACRVVAVESGSPAQAQGQAIAPASDEGEQAGKRFKLPAGLRVDLFAAEPMLANPVCFAIDEKGRFYVAETFRHSAVGPAYKFFEGVLDIRSHLDWLDEDLACRTVQDRIELLQRKFGADIGKMSRFSERVQLIEDRDGDGRADTSTIFAEGFNHFADGIGAGLLARDGKVWYTCIPNLWLLQDKDGDGKAELNEALHTGFGVHISFVGHDLHGLKHGPDGRIYFSLGDRGLSVQTKEGRRLEYPDEGVVLRCEPDGSNLEVFARGLRNPQELAFDDYGNLFTGDNNSDGGDRARWVEVVEGGDSGWRIGYQHLHAPPRRGPWNAERLWQPQWEGQAAYIVPPIANLGYGPAGVSYYPGTGLPDRYAGHFFLCDFRGGASSGIHSFTLKPKGAGHELASYEQFVWETLPTDVEFGVDGGVYFSDWVQGWNKTGKGRIYRAHSPEIDKSESVQQTKKLLSDGLSQKENQDLRAYLGHVDQRVRLNAQFELVKRGDKGVPGLNSSLMTSTNQLERIHAIWGLTQLARRSNTQAQLGLLFGLQDKDPEIRAQAARAQGDARNPQAVGKLSRLLSDPSPHVRLLAALSLAKFAPREVLQPVLTMLRENGDKDPYLRHAGVTVLAALKDAKFLASLKSDESPAVRMAAVIALRRLEAKEVANFLQDASPAIVLEAARAINDTPITGALPALASLAAETSKLLAECSKLPQSPGKTANKNAIEAALSDVAVETGTWTPAEQLFYRVINAAFRLGTAEHAKALGRLAADQAVPASLRAEAIAALGDWALPITRDRVTGAWSPLPKREAKPAADAFADWINHPNAETDSLVGLAAIRAIKNLQITGADARLAGLAGDNGQPGNLRAEALHAMAAIKSKELDTLLPKVLKDTNDIVRAEAVKVMSTLHPEEAAKNLAELLQSQNLSDRQNALKSLPLIKAEVAEDLLQPSLDALITGTLPSELELEVLETSLKLGRPASLAKVKQFELARPKTNMAPFRETLRGGNAGEGKKLFYERADIFCSRCHTISGEGGGAGPLLTGIGSRKPREYLLESIIFPNNQIAEGWENVVVTTQNGTSYTGKLKKETATDLLIDSPEDGEVKVAKSSVKSRERSLSAMPEEFRQILTKREIRDLVEFLSASTQ